VSLDASWPPCVVPVSCPRHRVAARAGARVVLAVIIVALAAAACTPPRRRVGAGAGGQGAAARLPSGGAQVTLDIDGVRRRMREAVGHVLLVHVWATWCAPCLYELPEFDKLAEKASARGVQVLALAVDSEYRDIARVADVLRTSAPHLAPIIVDYGGKNEFFHMFSQDWAGSIPATFIFDRTGKMHSQFLNVGEFRQMSAALDKLLEPR
jgi:thiol-disulfide isomerase/thioredoxin